MRIEIAQKWRPFSHTPGIRCMIPYTTWEVQIFPAKLKFSNLAGKEKEEKTLPIEGPVKGFTALLDLERGRVEVFGRGKKGYFRYFITPEEFPFLEKMAIKPSKKRLSLGVHKKQDWDLVLRRCDMAEVFPFWMRLADLIPKKSLPQKTVGTATLLAEGHFAETFQAAFQGILSPRLNDEKYLGLIPEKNIPSETSPIGLIHEGAKLIEELFFFQNENSWHFLPQLPKELHAGRFIYLETPEGDLIHMEWSKKELKKVIIQPAQTHQVNLILQSRLKSFRVRKSTRHKGHRASAGTSLELTKGQTLYLDRFEH